MKRQFARAIFCHPTGDRSTDYLREEYEKTKDALRNNPSSPQAREKMLNGW